MTRHSHKVQKKALLVALLACLVAGATAAQSGQQGEVDPTESAEAEVRRLSDLSDADMQREAETIQTRATRLSQRITRMLDEARQDRDIIRVTGLNGVLTETHATQRMIDDRAAALQQAISAGDTSRRNHEYTVLSVHGQNLSRLEQRANEVVGQDVFETGSTRVETEIADNTPEEDITNIPDEQALPVPYIPPPASGTM